MKMQFKFVEYMPDKIQEGIIYISPEYLSVIHLCACGCGEEINTPLSPTGWKIIYDGKDVSLEPSVGNWNYKCRSHYWIRKSEIVWADSWSDLKVDLKRKYDKKEAESYFKNMNTKDKNLEFKKANSDKSSIINISNSNWKRFLEWIKM